MKLRLPSIGYIFLGSKFLDDMNLGVGISGHLMVSFLLVITTDEGKLSIKKKSSSVIIITMPSIAIVAVAC